MVVQWAADMGQGQTRTARQAWHPTSTPVACFMRDAHAAMPAWALDLPTDYVPPLSCSGHLAFTSLSLQQRACGRRRAGMRHEAPASERAAAVLA